MTTELWTPTNHKELWTPDKPLPPLEELDEDELMMILEAQLMIADQKQEDSLARILELASLIEGKKGRGKTISAVAICWHLRERFGRLPIAIGSKMGLKPAFGDFKQMSEVRFKEELERIKTAADELEKDEPVDEDIVQEAAEQVARAFEKYGISVMYSTLVFDEATKLFDCRTPADKLVRVFGYFIDQSRHYHCTIIMCAPSRERIDKRVREQLDWQGRAFHNKYTDRCTLRLVSGLDTVTFDIDGLDDTKHPPFYEMYNSWNVLGFRTSHLNISKM